MLPISHGVISAGSGGAGSLTVVLDLHATFGPENPNPGFGNTTYNTNANQNILTAADSYNMPDFGPYAIATLGTTYEWLRVAMFDGPSIQVTGHAGGTPWQGYPTSGYNTAITITEGIAAYHPVTITNFISTVEADPEQNWALQAPNSKGHSSLNITFKGATQSPPNTTGIFYKIDVAVTEISSGLSGSASQVIRVENRTGIF